MDKKSQNLVRFVDPDGEVLYGLVPRAKLTNIIGSSIEVLEGDPFNDNLTPTKRTAIIHELLAPVAQPPIYLCIGLNYAAHAKEANISVPESPVLFMKPSDAYANPYDDIEIPQHATLMDYEGEMCIVIKKDGRNISEENVDDYILGYTVGNDISSRFWQRPPRSGGQFCYAKSLDKFAPIGPSLLMCPANEIGKLRLTTRVNGDIRQDTYLSDMIFDVSKLISHLSRGITLRKGTIIMTGTPAGIAAGMNKPNSPWLKDGDIVEINISEIGSIRNRFRQA